MRALLTFISCCFVFAAYGQSAKQSVRIQISYEKAGNFLEEAVERIEAVNAISKLVNVGYQAGKSVELLPGFEAKLGSVFQASIRPVAVEGEKTLRLTAFPNPFEHTATIEYYLPADGKVDLWITNAQGVRIRQLISEQSQPAGIHRMEWNADANAQGVYIPVIETDKQRITTRLIKK